MLNSGASKPRVKGRGRAPGTPLDPHLARQEVTSYRDLPCEQNDLTHACENITLPQSSFAGGNYVGLKVKCRQSSVSNKEMVLANLILVFVKPKR